MYCMKCGVKVSPGQERCPLCETGIYHPELVPEEGLPTYPRGEFESEAFNPRGILFVLTVFSLLCALLPMLSELVFYQRISWSGYVLGGVALGYVAFVLPHWFKNPNPVVFVPCVFAGALLFLLYIDLRCGSGWFLPFALPVVFLLGLLITAIVALCRYVRRGYLYIFGGGLIGLGVWTTLVEFFLWLAFRTSNVISWSLCSLFPLFSMGVMLIVIAIVKPLRESLRKKFFL